MFHFSCLIYSLICLLTPDVLLLLLLLLFLLLFLCFYQSQILAKKSSNIPASSSALKKRSDERTKLAMKNPIVAGVITTYNDPLLVAERSKRKKKGVGGSTAGSSVGGMSGADVSGNASRRNSDTSALSGGGTSTQSSIKTQSEVCRVLCSPTEAYEHHYDEDEFHTHQMTPSEKEADDKAHKRKPYMVVKRENTLTEYLLEQCSSSGEQE
jgi:hypothetical protein